MDTPIDNPISRFVAVFEDHLAVVEHGIPVSRNTAIHRKLLCVAIMDALSIPVMPRLPNRLRFSTFVRDFAQWDMSQRVSLPHLAQLARRSPDQDAADLLNFAISGMSSWMPGERVTLARDAAFEDVTSRWPRSEGGLTPLLGLTPEALQHAQLLYTYRNALAHEMRMLGHDLELWDTDDPYYTHLTIYGGSDQPNERSWQLQYPIAFLIRLCRNAIASVANELRSRDGDPFEAYNWSTYWLPGL